MKKKLIQWGLNLFKKTPDDKKRIRNIALACMGLTVLLSKAPGAINTPEWFIKYSWYIFGAFAAVATWAQGHAPTESEQEGGDDGTKL